MKYIYIGKIVNTHALKGEVRLISNFEFKERVFKKDFVFYIGNSKDMEVLETYRCHKQYDMVKFKGIDYINDVLKYKGCNVYISEDDLTLNDEELLESDYPGMELYNNDVLVGEIDHYRCDNGNAMLRVNDRYVPYNKNFITKIDKNNNRIYMHDIEAFL